MKALNWIAWITGGIGAVFIILGLISSLLGRLRPATESVNYFIAANSFLLVTIALFVFLYRCQCKKE